MEENENTTEENNPEPTDDTFDDKAAHDHASQDYAFDEPDIDATGDELGAADEATADTVSDSFDPTEAEIGAADLGPDPTETDAGFSGAEAGPAGAVTPPPGPSPDTGLVRDPYATFGGVMSGIAHRYGWDVSLTRLGFLASVILTGGSTLLLYILAWIIVPRANYWPPNGPRRSGGLSGRELGFGLAAAGVLIYLAVGTGSIGAAIVPLALVGGGVWLLLQHPRPLMAVAGSTETAAPVAPPAVEVGSVGAGSDGPPPPPHGYPVPPRKRRRRWVVALFAVLTAVMVGVAVIIGLIVYAVSEGEVNFDGGEKITRTPDSVSDLPIAIDADNGEITIDLSQLSEDDFVGLPTPFDVDVRLDVGAIKVEVPHDLAVNVDAEVGLGQVNLDGDVDGGINSQRTLRTIDPDLSIELDLDIGDITVERLDVAETADRRR